MSLRLPIGPVSQEWANERYKGLVEDNAAGQDVLAALNMLWLYFGDDPRKWHPAISYKYSMYQAAAIMGLNWRHGDWMFRPRANYVKQMRIYGVEEDRETGRLEVKSVWRWRHALSIARQTGRCPPSTFEKRINDPECEPSDPVDRADLPPIDPRGLVKRKLRTCGADPANIEKEMIHLGRKENTYDAKRAQWFRHETLELKESPFRQAKNLSFAAAARSALERLAR